MKKQQEDKIFEIKNKFRERESLFKMELEKKVTCLQEMIESKHENKKKELLDKKIMKDYKNVMKETK